MRIRVGLCIVLGLVPAMIQPSRAFGQRSLQGQQGQGRSQQSPSPGQEQVRAKWKPRCRSL